MEWALASVTTRDRAGAEEQASPEEIRTNHGLCWQQTVLEADALRQARVAARKGGLGLTSSAAVASAAYISFQALALARELTAASTRGSSTFLNRLRERPLAKALIAALRQVAEIGTERQLEDAVAASWAAIAAGKEMEGKGREEKGTEGTENGSLPTVRSKIPGVGRKQ